MIKLTTPISEAAHCSQKVGAEMQITGKLYPGHAGQL